MKVHGRFLAVLLAALLASASCSGSENDTAEATPVPTTSAVAEAEPSPTVAVVAAPRATNEQRIAAALNQLAIDVAGDEPISPSIDSLIAYDVMDTTVNPKTGDVTITICGWPEGTVFDTVRANLYSTKTTSDGTVTATHITSPTGPGECLNTELINTALDHIDEFDVYWENMLTDPASFDPDRVSGTLFAEELVLRTSALTEGWVSDEIYFAEAFAPDGDLRSGTVADLLYRRYIDNDLEILEVVVCRNMNPASGIYRGGALIDDERSPDAPGLHAVNAYQLVRANEPGSRWLVAGNPALVWSDCLGVDDWAAAANGWRPRAAPLEVLEL